MDSKVQIVIDEYNAGNFSIRAKEKRLLVRAIVSDVETMKTVLKNMHDAVMNHHNDNFEYPLKCQLSVAFIGNEYRLRIDCQ